MLCKTAATRAFNFPIAVVQQCCPSAAQAPVDPLQTAKGGMTTTTKQQIVKSSEVPPSCNYNVKG